MIYKNNSNITKTFYGVTFAPGDIKEVRGFINHPKFSVEKELPKEPPKVSEPKPETPAKTAPAKNDKREEKEPDGEDNHQ